MAGAGGYDDAARWWRDMVDGTLRRLGKSREQFDHDVIVCGEEFEAEYESMRRNPRHIDPRVTEIPESFAAAA